MTITTEPCPGTHDRVWTTYAALPHDVAPGNRILIDDGNIALEVVAVEADGVPALPPLTEAPWTPGGAIARAAADVASVLGARALVVFTTSGEGAHRLSRHRPLTPLLAYTPDPVVRSVMALTWGGWKPSPCRCPPAPKTWCPRSTPRLRLGRGAVGDLVVIIGGSPIGTPGTTNFLRVHRLSGPCAGRRSPTGFRVRMASQEARGLARSATRARSALTGMAASGSTAAWASRSSSHSRIRVVTFTPRAAAAERKASMTGLGNRSA